MPFEKKKSPLILSPEVRERLLALSRSRTESAQHVERARILLEYAGGNSVALIAQRLGTNRPKVNQCINKALQLGALAALDDLAGRGKPPSISSEARAWLISLACQKPKDLGYSYELWTTRLLATYIHEHCREAGHPSLSKISRGTVSKILSRSEIRPHKIDYYLEKRDPEFDAKMAEVLCVYREVQMLREKGEDSSSMIAVLSFDEKPGIQAISNMGQDLPPTPEKHPNWSRDHEYVRHGTLCLMAGIDLLSGKVHAIIEERQRSKEFIAFLKMIDEQYPKSATIRMVLDNRSAHISKETRAFLAEVPNRFEFIFTPTHGSWLNLIETFFAKMAKTILRGIRVSSKEELKQRIEQYLKETNEEPVVFRWKYKIEPVVAA
jgi:transposase